MSYFCLNFKQPPMIIMPLLLECQCDIRGILLSDGCNQETGACSCKRNVIGRDCNQCRPEHYGLSLEDELGCQPCDCDIGGAHDNNCDVISGQCKCRPNTEGRRYSEVVLKNAALGAVKHKTKLQTKMFLHHLILLYCSPNFQ